MTQQSSLTMATIDAEKAFATSARNRAARWPNSNGNENRLFPDCRPKLKPKFQIARDARVFAIGSCFARNIEEYLVRLGIDVVSSSLEFPESEMLPGSRRNDLLVKYTPPSVLQELRFALDPESTFDDQLKFIVPLRDGNTVDLTIPSWYSAVSQERAVERRRQINDLYAKIPTVDLVIITLGLVEAWYDRQGEGFICEPPSQQLMKEHPGRFAFVRLDFGQAKQYTQQCIDLIRQANPAIKIVLTTSPVPLGRTFTGDDIIVANGYSKAVLRAVAGEISADDPMVDYYPSYEMVMLSDFSASWEADQRHVKDSRVGDVVRTFIASYFPDASDGLADVRARYLEANILSSKRQFAEALKEFKSLERFFPGDLGFLKDFSRAAEGGRNFELAADLLQRLNRLEGRTDMRDVQLGNCYAYLGRHEEALALAEAIGSRYIGAPIVKIDALIALGRKEPARALARAMVETIQKDNQPRYIWVYTRLEHSFRSLGDLDDAEAVRLLGKTHLTAA
jgi:tetratricopeptide (TPR) repeat protein